MTTNKKWMTFALAYLNESLTPIPHELNELDWKVDASSRGMNLAKHLSAFANLTSGGYLVFGVHDSGEAVGLSQDSIKNIISKIGSIAREGVEPKISVDHAISDYHGKTLLFIHIKEASEKPVHLRGKGIEESYIRSGSSTHKMSKQEIGWCLLRSKVPNFEEQDAGAFGSLTDLLSELDVATFFDVLGTPLPSNHQAILHKLEEYRLIKCDESHYRINNLGVLLLAKNMSHFAAHARRGIRVICYKGTSKIDASKDKTFEHGYAISLNEALTYIQEQLPSSEVIHDALRENIVVYPQVAIREILANAIIHQDFSVDTMNPKVEIFSDRIEITNPGTLIAKTSIDRLIGSTNPRNELFARTMYKMRICEDRGSGLIRALNAIELYGLAPLKFEVSPSSFKVVIRGPKNYQEMGKQERIDACFQHCVLKYLSSEKMTNASLRKRLGIAEQNYALASRIIKDALDQNKIKIGNPDIKNAKYVYYVPFYT